jgi:hypothetical protein
VVAREVVLGAISALGFDETKRTLHSNDRSEVTADRGPGDRLRLAALAPVLAADLFGAGATFLYPIYAQWGDA